jgi:hypothetical protein
MLAVSLLTRAIARATDGGMTEITRDEVLALLGGETKTDGHRQFLVEARVAAVAYAGLRIGEGASPTEVAEELKLNRWTLQRWLQRRRKGELGGGATDEAKGFRQVKLKKVPATEKTSVVVHGACGVRVEGLSFEAVVKLLERLSCSV